MTRAHGVAVLACALLVASVVAADEGDGPIGEPAIPPGEEELIAGMLGRGMALRECTLVSGGVEYTVIKATYACPAGEVVLLLDHPRNATAASMVTARFAVTLQSGAPPAGFGDALASLIRAREAAFVWSWAEPEGAAAAAETAE